MKTLTAIVLTFLLPVALFADDRDICSDSDLNASERIAACTRVVEASDNDPQALARLGNALIDGDLLPEAIEALTQAVVIAPDYVFARQRRSVAYNKADRDGEAEQDLLHLTQIAPDNDWNFYRLGYTRRKLGKYDDALAALGQAIALDGDYYWSHFERGRVLSLMDRDEEAGNSYTAAAHIKPLSESIHSRAYRSFNFVGLPERAAYHARIIYTLDPNALTLRDWLQEYVGTGTSSELEPLAWVAPPKDQEIRYFQIFAPVDNRDEMEVAIEDLFNWFGGKSYPMPETASVYRQSFEADGADDLHPNRVVEHKNSDSPPKLPRQNVFRGLFQLDVQPLGPNSPVISPQWGDNNPGQVWPLVDGNIAQGTAVYAAMCDTGGGMPAIVIGCRPDIRTVPLGQFDWSIKVTTERIHVPMGIFDTYKISFHLRGDITILGKTNTAEYDASYWLEPELNTWVAAIFTIGDKYSYSQAMEIVE